MVNRKCLILGGSGYIGSRLARRLVQTKEFSQVVVADLRDDGLNARTGIEFVRCDVRKPLAPQLPSFSPDWIFNLAAVHREPGHSRSEYFATNIPGAIHATEYASAIGCRNILFTSSIATYGPTNGPTSEASETMPTTAYGISKLTAEWIHRAWQAADACRRIVICRPGVIYGPGDPGNILRMIRAVRRGYFVFPGSRELRKSYGYVEGLLDSFQFALDRVDPLMLYNYVEMETLTLEELVGNVRKHFGKRCPTLAIPLPALACAARLVHVLSAGRSPIHPDRVRKAATSTHIVPKLLMESGFDFRYNFRTSLAEWAAVAPEDFD